MFEQGVDGVFTIPATLADDVDRNLANEVTRVLKMNFAQDTNENVFQSICDALNHSPDIHTRLRSARKGSIHKRPRSNESEDVIMYERSEEGEEAEGKRPHLKQQQQQQQAPRVAHT